MSPISIITKHSWINTGSYPWRLCSGSERQRPRAGRLLWLWRLLCVAWGSSERLYAHNQRRWELLFQAPLSLKNFLKASGARQTFFAEKKIKNKLWPLECLPSILPSAGYGTCTWHWLWPRKAQGNRNSKKSSNTATTEALSHDPCCYLNMCLEKCLPLIQDTSVKSHLTEV